MGFGKEVPGYDDYLYTRDGAIKIDAEGRLVTSMVITMWESMPWILKPMT